MKKSIVAIFFILAGLHVFATGDENLKRTGLRKLQPKSSLSDSAWNKMHYLDKYPNPTFTLQLGGMWLNNNAKLRINSDRLGVGTAIDLNRDLGINPSAFAPLAELRFRIGKRHQIVASGFGYARSKSKSLSRDISFLDTTFYANASVRAKTHFIAYNFDYRFSILRVPRGELGLSIGIKVYDVYASIAATANENNVDYSQRKRVYAPALLPGIHGSYYITSKLLFRAKAEYFQLTVSDWNFKVFEIKPSLEFYPLPNLGIGAAYSYFNIRVSRLPSENLDGQVNYIINGASLFASVRF